MYIVFQEKTLDIFFLFPGKSNCVHTHFKIPLETVQRGTGWLLRNCVNCCSCYLLSTAWLTRVAASFYMARSDVKADCHWPAHRPTRRLKKADDVEAPKKVRKSFAKLSLRFLPLLEYIFCGFINELFSAHLKSLAWRYYSPWNIPLAIIQRAKICAPLSRQLVAKWRHDLTASRRRKMAVKVINNKAGL